MSTSRLNRNKVSNLTVPLGFDGLEEYSKTSDDEIEEKRSTLTRRASLNEWSEKDESSLLKVRKGQDVRFALYLLLTIGFEVEERWQLIVVVEDHWQTLYPEQSIQRQSKHRRRVLDEKHLFARASFSFLAKEHSSLSLSTSVEEWLFRVDWIFSLTCSIFSDSSLVDPQRRSISFSQHWPRRKLIVDDRTLNEKDNQRGLTDDEGKKLVLVKVTFFFGSERATQTRSIQEHNRMRQQRRIDALPFSFSLSLVVVVECLEEERERENNLNICLYISSVISDVFFFPSSDRLCLPVAWGRFCSRAPLIFNLGR